jgi:hypothetical protein
MKKYRVEKHYNKVEIYIVECEESEDPKDFVERNWDLEPDDIVEDFDHYNVIDKEMDDAMELIGRMRRIDWYYNYSDDYSVWSRGRNQVEKLISDLSKMNLTEKDLANLKEASRIYNQVSGKDQEKIDAMNSDWDSRLDHLYRSAQNGK